MIKILVTCKNDMSGVARTIFLKMFFSKQGCTSSENRGVFIAVSQRHQFHIIMESKILHIYGIMNLTQAWDDRLYIIMESQILHNYGITLS